MSPARTALLFFACVVLSVAQNKDGGVVALDHPFNTTVLPQNFRDKATLSVTSSSLPVSVCVVLAAYPLPHYTQFAAETCIYYFNTTALNTELYLRDVQYRVGVYLSAPQEAQGKNTTVSVTVTGDVCPEGSYYDGADCIAAKPLTNHTTANFAAGETKFWTFTNAFHVGSFSISLDRAFDERELSAEELEIWASFESGPSATKNDGRDTNGTLTVVSPRPGLWVVGVHAAVAGSVQFTFTTELCGANQGGLGCSVDSPDIVNNVNVTLLRAPFYWRITANPAYPLLVSVTTANTTDLPLVYATKGTLPLANGANADIFNCNEAFCTEVRSIKFNVTAEEDWYVVVVNPRESGNITFAIWWNSTCIVGCTTDNHGTCDASGRCECEIDRIGLDCSIQNGFPPPYIVLIIIASLVVASALIGFVAWAYMRRKRANYEIVS